MFVDAGGREFRVPRAEIEEVTFTPLSPMPANMGDQVGVEGLPDFIVYPSGAKPD